MPPLKFPPLLKRIRWGGRRLGSLLSKPLGAGDDWAESWEIADHGEDQTIVAGGPFDGWTLSRLVRERNHDLFGDATFQQFPLLIKFLDAHDRLSLQVHPNDQQARRYDPNENGKTEAWVILAAEPGSSLYAGLQPGVTADMLRDALADGTVERFLNRFSVAPGDCVFVPAGTVHAIGEGIVLAEIQQQSDITFRLHDWGRLGGDGKPRELHIDQGLECIDFQRGPVQPVTPRELAPKPHRVEELVACDYFHIRRHTLAATSSLPAERHFRVLVTIAGSGELAGDSETVPLPMGQTVLLPASTADCRITPQGECVVLEAFVPAP